MFQTMQIKSDVVASLSAEAAAYVAEHACTNKLGNAVLVAEMSCPADVAEELTSRFGSPRGDEWTSWVIKGDNVEPYEG